MSNDKDDDRSLWSRFTQGIRPLKGREMPIEATPPLQKTSKKLKTSIAAPLAVPKAETIQEVAQNTLDWRTLDKLKKGKMPIEAVLDLHGLNQEQAYNAFHGFVTRSSVAQMRCILVITGKGKRDDESFYSIGERSQRGILRERVQDWVRQAPLSAHVLRCEPAHRTHGGTGAFYLYLKRN